MDDQTIFTTRSFAVPRQEAFRAFRQPALLARWWGPNGFHNTIKAFHFAPGGVWKLTMHGPDGVDYPNESVFTEIVENERVALEHFGSHYLADYRFFDEGAGCRIDWSMRFDSAEDCERMREFVVQANSENLDRLANLLERGGPAWGAS